MVQPRVVGSPQIRGPVPAAYPCHALPLGAWPFSLFSQIFVRYLCKDILIIRIFPGD